MIDFTKSYKLAKIWAGIWYFFTFGGFWYAFSSGGYSLFDIIYYVIIISSIGIFPMAIIKHMRNNKEKKLSSTNNFL